MNEIGLNAIPPLFAKFEGSIILLVSVIALDYLTGILKAIMYKKVNSTIGLKGIVKKFGIILITLFGYIADILLGNHTNISSLMASFFVANEGISILENWKDMNLPLPKKIYEIFDNLRSETDGGNKS